MRLIMAVSKDNYVARGPKDDMSWTGRQDKAVFRVLTSGCAVGLGRRTSVLMPETLRGRELVGLSRTGHGLTLNDFRREFPDGWLGGGLQLATAAKKLNLLFDIYLCRSDRLCFGTNEDYLFDATFFLHDMELILSTAFGDVTVEHWRASCTFKGDMK